MKQRRPQGAKTEGVELSRTSRATETRALSTAHPSSRSAEHSDVAPVVYRTNIENFGRSTHRRTRNIAVPQPSATPCRQDT